MGDRSGGMRRMEPYTPVWQREANRIARDFAPPILPCSRCGYPLVSGYCCGSCGCPCGRGPCQCHKAIAGRGKP